MSFEQLGRDIIDANLYMVLATADATGVPWSSPVYFANSGYAEFFWVSVPDRTHSHNIAVRPAVSIVIFDSHAPIGTGQAVYLSAVAEQAGPADVERGIEVFSRRSLGHGGYAWTCDDVQGDAGLRLYRAVADQHWMLAKDGGPDRRTAVALG
jgi:Pyridoxamine 5'-phosphate oxidase